jgi:ribosomal protein L39E
MSRNKTTGFKKRLTALGKRRSAPRWADIKKYGLKRARSRRIRVRTKHWRRDKLKV